ncbi:MAG TPA: nuclear transport factor 2 family protein [Solirubrobacterales bacterium]
MDQADREELARRSIEAWNADDWEEGLAAIWSRDGLIVSPQGWPEAGEFKGLPAMVEQWRRIKDSWEEEHVELLAVESVGLRVLASVRWVMRGETSGAPLDVPAWMLFSFKGGRISRIEYFLDESGARAAVEEVR